jgi:hypothetical protein
VSKLNRLIQLADDEVVVRFIIKKRDVRADNTVKPEAFKPPRSGELSVTRAATRSDEDIWDRGRVVAASHAVAAKRDLRLIGGARLTAIDVRAAEPLNVVEAPIIPDDPFHAHIIGWPLIGSEKERQKMLTVLLASRAKYQPVLTPR